MLILFLPILAIGCGGGETSSTVAGKVTYKGAPVTGGTLKFYPEGSKDVFITGAINPDGTFSLINVPKGKSKVVVETDSIKQQALMNERLKDKSGKTPGAAGPTPVYVQIPAKYARPDTTDLTCEVKSGKNTSDLDLKD